MCSCFGDDCRSALMVAAPSPEGAFVSSLRVGVGSTMFLMMSFAAEEPVIVSIRVLFGSRLFPLGSFSSWHIVCAIKMVVNSADVLSAFLVLGMQSWRLPVFMTVRLSLSISMKLPPYCGSSSKNAPWVFPSCAISAWWSRAFWLL